MVALALVTEKTSAFRHFERASDMKEQYGILKEYMIEENLFDKGVLDEYK